MKAFKEGGKTDYGWKPEVSEDGEGGIKYIASILS